MKVLLVCPPNPAYCVLNEDFSCCEPLGLEYVAASLLPSHDVEMLDMRFDDGLERRLSAGAFSAVGIAVPFTTSINTVNRLLRRVHAHDPRIIRIIGGHYPSTSLEKIDLGYVDYVIRGEGVHAARELLDAVDAGGEVRQIPGVVTIQGGEPLGGPRQAKIDLDACPLPARPLLSRHRDEYFHAHYRPVALMRFSAGCPFDCSFCILWKMTDRQYLTRSVESILAELQTIESENVYVVDDEAFIQAPRMAALADEIIRSGIRKRFHMYVRSDTIARNASLFEKWAEAGLDSVLVGLESIFPDELEDYKKKISLHLARECMRVLHKSGVEVRANFIVRPDYTVEKFRRVREIVSELDIDRPTFAVLTPFIGTDTFEQVKDRLILDEPELYDCYHTLLPTALPLRTFYKEFADLFRAAQRRGGPSGDSKIFYAGKGDSFETFVEKIESSYRFYEPHE
jgi:methyltransferase